MAAALVADVVPGPVPDDLPQPGAEPSRLATFVDPLHRIDHRLLTHVFGPVEFADNRQGHGPAPAKVSLDQQSAGRPASLSHLLDEIRIGFIHCITDRAPEATRVLR